MPVVEQQDAQQMLADFVAEVIAAGYLPTPAAGQAWRRGTRVEPGKTPTWFIQVRLVGGSDEQRVAQRPLVDLRVWADASALAEFTALKAARVLHARIRQRFPCSTFAVPVPLPDPVDNTRMHALFTVQLLTRGAQS